MEELVSIIIPAYQEEKKIERCLQSILKSSYQNMELIIVNDGSTDDTERVVREFIKRNKSKKTLIKLVSIPNGGSAKARNYGLNFVKGSYIGFVDADDMIQPHMIKQLVESLQRGNDLSICGILFCNEEGNPGLFQYRLYKQRKQCPQQAMEMVMWKQIQMSMCSVLFRREIIMNTDDKPGLFCPEDVAAFEDFAFVCEYINRCDGFMEILPFRGYCYCKHTKSALSTLYTAEEIRHALQPILNAGMQINNPQFIAHKLQYSFRFMAFWYEKAIRSNRNEFLPNCEDWEICMCELERYVDVFMKAPNVSLYKKIAMWIVRKHPNIGWILAKIIGRMIVREESN